MNRIGTLGFVWAMLLLSVVGQLSAALPVPPGLNPGDPYHLVFVSSVPSSASLGGIAGADAFVQGLADAAGVGNTVGVSWQAILSNSTGTNAFTRFSPAAPIYNMQGILVANSGTDLWNTTSAPLLNPIAFDETGAGSATILVEVWTGTKPTGTFDQADSDWLAASANTFATAGSSIAVNTDWINGGGFPAENVPLSVFASSEVLFAPNTVPEPSTFVHGILGLLLLSFSGGRRRDR